MVQKIDLSGIKHETVDEKNNDKKNSSVDKSQSQNVGKKGFWDYYTNSIICHFTIFFLFSAVIVFGGGMRALAEKATVPGDDIVEFVDNLNNRLSARMETDHNNLMAGKPEKSMAGSTGSKIGPKSKPRSSVGTSTNTASTNALTNAASTNTSITASTNTASTNVSTNASAGAGLVKKETMSADKDFYKSLEDNSETQAHLAQVISETKFFEFTEQGETIEKGTLGDTKSMEAFDFNKTEKPAAILVMGGMDNEVLWRQLEVLNDLGPQIYANVAGKIILQSDLGQIQKTVARNKELLDSLVKNFQVYIIANEDLTRGSKEAGTSMGLFIHFIKRNEENKFIPMLTEQTFMDKPMLEEKIQILFNISPTYGQMAP